MTEIFGLFTLCLLSALSYAWLTRNLEKARRKKAGQAGRIRMDYETLMSQSREVQEEHIMLTSEFDEAVALYDMAKEITKHLDEEKVFSSFREKLGQYLRFTDCRYFREQVEPGYDRVLTLKLGKQEAGFLAASGIDDRDAEKFQIMGEQFILGIKRAILYRKVQEMATYDSLTHVYTRRYWFERSRQEIERSRRFCLTASCLMVDVDHFKAINDHYGHLVGDSILVEVSKMIRESIRQIDLFGKYGGEEFCILLTETDRENAVYVAERIRQAIDQKQIRAYDEDLHVTVSVGVSVFPGGGEGLEGLIETADSALYRAKQTGRNKVCALQAPAS